MSKITAFDTAWSAEIIERFTPETGEPQFDGLARALLASACIISESIDRLTESLKAAKKDDA